MEVNIQKFALSLDDKQTAIGENLPALDEKFEVSIPDDEDENEKENWGVLESDVIELIPNKKFGVDLWEFRYNNYYKQYELSGIYYDGFKQFFSRYNVHKRYINPRSSITIVEASGIIDEVSTTQVKDFVQEYMQNLPNEVLLSIGDAPRFTILKEALNNVILRQIHNIANDKWLENLNIHTKPILNDSPDVVYFTFLNCIAKVTKDKDEIEILPLETLESQCEWKSRQIQRDFEIADDFEQGEFYKFCENVTKGVDGRFDALISAIGFLLHNFRKATKNEAIILYDEALTTTNKPQGRTGKGLIANAIRQMRDTVKIDGKQYDSNDRFKFDRITPATQVAWIDETNKKFDFKDLFSSLTDGFLVERKHQKKFLIEPEHSPNILITSNEILPFEGTSFEGRQFIVELNDYYSSKLKKGNENPVEKEHGGILFSSDWNSQQWNRFQTFMIFCTQYYLSNGLKPYTNKNVKINFLRQKIKDSEFFDWIETDPIPLNTEFEIKPLFERFKTTFLGSDSEMKQRTFTQYIKQYASVLNLNLQSRTSNGSLIYILKSD